VPHEEIPGRTVGDVLGFLGGLGARDPLADDAAAAHEALEAYLRGHLPLEQAVAALIRIDGRTSFDLSWGGSLVSAEDQALAARYATLAARLGWPPKRAR
jgi:hypothetical protein